MSEPLEVVALLRELMRKEITLGILDAELIKNQCTNASGVFNRADYIRNILQIEKDVSDLSTRFVHTAEKL